MDVNGVCHGVSGESHSHLELARTEAAEACDVMCLLVVDTSLTLPTHNSMIEGLNCVLSRTVDL